MEAKNYVCVKDSSSFVEFGNQQMSVPRSKSKIKSRKFLDLKADTVQTRKAEVEK